MGAAFAAFLVVVLGLAVFLGPGLVTAEALVLVTRPVLVLPSTSFSSTTAGAAVGVFLVRLAPVLDLGFAAGFLVVVAFFAAGLAVLVLVPVFLGAAFLVVVVVAADLGFAAAFFAAGFFSVAGLEAASFLASLMGPEVPLMIGVSG